MLDALVIVRRGAVPLARTLASLVPGAVEGDLRRVAVIADLAGPDILDVIEAAGCEAIGGVPDRTSLQRAEAILTGPWLILADDGTVLPPGWPAALRQRLAVAETDGRSAVRFLPPGAGGAWSRRWQGLRGHVRVGDGLVVPKAALRRFDAAAGLVRGIRALTIC